MRHHDIKVRRCVACRKQQNKYELIRIVRGEKEAIWDESLEANARGAYCCKSSDCIKKALKTKAFNRSLKQPLSEMTILHLEEFSNECK